MTGITRTAELSSCGTYRWTLTRAWDGRPMLLVVMFNPSTANAEVDDPTIALLCHIAAHNGYGGIVVVNGIPLRSSTPERALQMLEWERARDWGARDALQNNVATIVGQVERAGAVLLAWGALAWKTNASANWFDIVLEEIEAALPDGTPLLCLGKTLAGLPLHPLARGKLKVRKDATLAPWAKGTPAGHRPSAALPGR